MNIFFLIALLITTFSTFTMELNSSSKCKELSQFIDSPLTEFEHKKSIEIFRELLREPLNDGYNKNKIRRIGDPDRLVLNREISKLVVQTYAAQWAPKYKEDRTLVLGRLRDITSYLVKLNFVYTQKEGEFYSPLRKESGKYLLTRFTDVQQLEDGQHYFTSVKSQIPSDFQENFIRFLTFILIIKQPDFDNIELPKQALEQAIQATSKVPTQALTLPAKTATLPIMLSHKTNSTGALPNRKYQLATGKAASFTNTLDVWKEKEKAQ